MFFIKILPVYPFIRYSISKQRKLRKLISYLISFIMIWKEVPHMILDIYLINWPYSGNVNDTLEANVMWASNMEKQRTSDQKRWKYKIVYFQCAKLELFCHLEYFVLRERYPKINVLVHVNQKIMLYLDIHIGFFDIVVWQEKFNLFLEAINPCIWIFLAVLLNSQYWYLIMNFQ